MTHTTPTSLPQLFEFLRTLIQHTTPCCCCISQAGHADKCERQLFSFVLSHHPIMLVPHTYAGLILRRKVKGTATQPCMSAYLCTCTRTTHSSYSYLLELTAWSCRATSALTLTSIFFPQSSRLGYDRTSMKYSHQRLLWRRHESAISHVSHVQWCTLSLWRDGILHVSFAAFPTEGCL